MNILHVINQAAGVCSTTSTFLPKVMADRGELNQPRHSSVAKPKRDTRADILVLDLLHSEK